jgi:GcrA cell cycle regulator
MGDRKAMGKLVHVRGSEWSEERVERLKVLHARGLSCAMIADDLGEGISRCAVIGKLHRLGMSNAGSIVRKANTKKTLRPKVEKTVRIVKANGNSNRMRLFQVAKIETQEMRCADVVSLGIGLLELQPHQCRYPTSDAPFLFCGHRKMEGSSYCAPHFMLTHRSDADRRAKVPEAA